MEAEGRHEPLSAGESRPKTESSSKCPFLSVALRADVGPGPVRVETGPMFASLSPPEIQRSALAALGAVSRALPADGRSHNRTDGGGCSQSRGVTAAQVIRNELAKSGAPCYISVSLSLAYVGRLGSKQGSNGLIGIFATQSKRMGEVC